MVFFLVDSSTGDLARHRSATRGHLQITLAPGPLLKHALEAGRAYLAELERLQPSEQSGGQRSGGIQDHVYVVRPDGGFYQVKWPDA